MVGQDAEYNAVKWATDREPRAEIIERYQRVCEHSDTTIDPLDLGALGHVPWWPRPEGMAASSGLASTGAYPSPEADVEG